LIQVAADLGIFGLLAFAYLIYRGLRTSLWLRRVLGPQPARRPPSEASQVLAREDRELLHDHSVAMGAALLGWFAAAMFASVAYSWTFYFLLALTVVSRELILDRIRERYAGTTTSGEPAPRHALRTDASPVRA
jgi:hypothetical protein